MKIAVRFVLALGACSLALSVGCASDKSMSEAKGDQKVVAVNKTCPMSAEAVDPSVNENVGGQTVAFCCGSCKAKFDKMTDAQKTAAVQKVTAAAK